MRKDLLSDTDYAKGHDNRFGNSVLIGFVSKIECNDKQANVRVILPDKVDHEDTPLITKPVPVLQVASTAKKSFAVPRLGTPVMMIKMPNGTSDYMVIGGIYTAKNPPPVTDPKLDYTEWEGGHIQKFDANDDADVFLTQDFKGGWNATIKKDVNFKTTDAANFNIDADGDVLINSATGNIDIKSPTGTVTVEQQTVELKATTIKLTGHVIVVGDIDQTGHHTDSRGIHTGAHAEDLLARIEELERRVTALEARQP
jgi:phage baseplate assembly protein gpV